MNDRIVSHTSTEDFVNVTEFHCGICEQTTLIDPMMRVGRCACGAYDWKPGKGRIMTYAEARDEFYAYIADALPPNDLPAKREAWNNYTDGLCKEGLITQKQYDTWQSPWKEK